MIVIIMNYYVRNHFVMVSIYYITISSNFFEKDFDTQNAYRNYQFSMFRVSFFPADRAMRHSSAEMHIRTS